MVTPSQRLDAVRHPGFVVLLAASVIAPAPAQQVTTPRLESALRAAAGDGGSAVAAGAGAMGEVLAVAAFGRHAGDALRPDTPLPVGELAREFTAAITLQLVARGTVGLDQPVHLHFRFVPDCWHTLTVRHLLTGCSGIVPRLDLAAAELRDRDRFVEAVFRNRPLHPPGDVVRDNASDWALLAALAEATTVTPFGQLLRERLFLPAGMRSAYLAASATWADLGNGGVSCSVHDLLAWATATGEGPLLDDRSREFLLAYEGGGVPLLGTPVRDGGGAIRSVVHLAAGAAIVRHVSAGVDVALIAAGGELDVAAATTALVDSLWPAAPASADFDRFAGRYRLGAKDWLEVRILAETLVVGAVGQEAGARLQHGGPRHPEWPDLFAEFAAHALLHLRPLLKLDAASLERAFDSRADPGAAAEALQTVERLIAEHGKPGPPLLVGTSTMGTAATWVRVAFGREHVATLRLQWFGYKLARLVVEDHDLPLRLPFQRTGESRFTSTSLDGKQALRVEFETDRSGRVTRLQWYDASRKGQGGLVCPRIRS